MVYDFENTQFFISRDVIVFENEFPFINSASSDGVALPAMFSDPITINNNFTHEKDVT